MSINKRTRLYKKENVNSNMELDYLDSSLQDLDLSTERNFRIPQTMEYRPDLIAYKFYGDFNLGWLIALHNGMIDPIFEFTSGKLIEIPSITEYYRFYNRNARRRD